MDTTFLLLLLGALGFGIAHAFEPDHMAAVSTFVAGRPKPREAALFGVKWAVGHGFSLFVIGSALFFLRRAAEAAQPTLFSSGLLERIVGLVLVGLGVWTLFQIVSSRASKQHAHGHFHDGHFHSHDESDAAQPHAHSHAGGLASLGMGVLHGAAGTGAFVGQAAVSLSSSYAFVFLYTLLFSVGVLIAMAVYAGALGGLITAFEKRGQQALTGARVVTAVLTCGIGFCLISGIPLPGVFDTFMH